MSGVFNSGCRASRRFSRYEGEQLVRRISIRERDGFMGEDVEGIIEQSNNRIIEQSNTRMTNFLIIRSRLIVLASRFQTVSGMDRG